MRPLVGPRATHDYVAPIAELTEHLGIDGHPHVLGQSWGGMLGLVHALEHPPGPAERRRRRLTRLDRRLRGRRQASRVPAASGLLFEDSSHMPHLEERERFLAVVEAFLERVEG